MKEIQIAFIKHTSAKDIVISYFRYDYPRMIEKNLLKQETEFELDMEDEVVYPGTVAEVVTVVNKLGVWGFCDKITHGDKKPEIHYWVNSPDADRIKVMELFSHEVAHAVGYSSEKMACKYGGVAAFSYYSMMEEVYNLDAKTGKKKRK